MENPSLKEPVAPDNDLKNMLIEYVGEKLNPHDQLVTMEMVVDVLAQEFPDFLLVIAEENWIRGYQQGLEDVESGQKMVENEKRKTCKLCEE